ncbi:MAG TPA: hypothetical protein VK308_11110 [Pyrinomonadaceae bacterium]|nr:hypothetical protein [Pyrinomonadaceae bacterium]
MKERTKVITLILSQTIIIGLDYAIEGISGEYTETNLKFFILSLPFLLICVVFGFFTENAKKLLVYSMVIMSVNMIFLCSDIYFSPDQYEETLQLYGDSLFIFLAFAFAFIFILSLILIGLGMILSQLFKVIFKKQADKF